MRRTNYSSIDWTLLARYLNRESSDGDEAAVHDWLNKDEQNRKLLETVREKWEKINVMGEEKFDVDLAWKNVRQRITGTGEQYQGPGTGRLLKKPAPSFAFIARIAAIIILILGSSYLLISQFTTISSFLTGTTVVESDAAGGKSVRLPDGSLIQLNASSRIIYNENKKEHLRKVRLTGEAFFNVSHDAGNPFIVNANKAVVRVIGTSFNINAGEDKVSVYVESGKVELSGTGSDQSPVIIEAGFAGTVTGSRIERFSPTNPNILSWKTKNLVFHETRMTEVLEALNHTFHRNIICAEEKIGDLHFTGNFNNQPVDTILQVLSTAFDLTVEYKSSSIELKLDE
jgi:ferric-dicitrate binding protein FerR (iron transport regulator)